MGDSFPVEDVLKELCNQFSKKTTGKVKPWKEFFDGFNIPEWKREYLFRRFFTNLVYFGGNYILLFLITMIICMVADPLFTLCIFLIIVGWLCLFYLYHQKIIVFENDRCIPIILAGLFFTLFCLSLFKRIGKFINIVAVVIVFVVCHGCLKKRSLKSRLVMRSVRLPFSWSSSSGSESGVIPLVLHSPNRGNGLNNRTGKAGQTSDIENNLPFEDTESDSC